MASNTTSSAKTHVSLRLPTYILESIDAHAEKESISRTEAFVFYLQTGLDIADTKANEPSKDESMLQSIQDELAEIKALLLTQQGGQPVQLEAIEEDEADELASSEDEADDFTTSDAVSFTEDDAVPAEEEDAEDEDDRVAEVEESSDDEDADQVAESEAFAESYFSTSDAVDEETVTEEDEDDNEEDAFDDSDAVIEESSTDEVSSLYAVGESESFTEIKPVDDADEFTTSDATSLDSTDDGSEDEALSHKKLEKAIAKAAKDISAIEKVWLYGAAAESKEITEPALDLCVKTEDDEIKPKHLEAFVAAIEEKTGKLVKVVLRHEVNKEQKQTMKNRVELYKK